MKRTPNCSALRIVAFVFLAVFVRLNASTIYFDKFDRVGALVGSQPANTTSGNVWTGFGVVTSDPVVQTNGSAAVFPSAVNSADGRPFTDGSADDREPSLAFVAPANSVVTLSAIFTVTSGSGPYAGWLAMGFINDSSSNPGLFSSTGPMINLAMDGSVNASAFFLSDMAHNVYTGNPGYGSSQVDLKIVYDNTDPSNVTATFFASGMELASYSYGSAGFNFDHVFLRSYLLGGGYVDNFKLSVTDEHEGNSVPDNSSTICLMTLSLGGLFALRRKYFKYKLVQVTRVEA